MSNDGFNWHAHARIDKYSPEVVTELTRILGYEPQADDFKRFSADPFLVTEVDGNLLTTAGLGNLTNLAIGGGGTTLTTSSGIIGTGSTATAATQADPNLGANGTAANGTVGCWYQGVSSVTRVTTSVTSDTVQVVSTFASADGNYAWQEWGLAVTPSGTITGNATLATVSSGSEIFLNHKIASMGTKASGASWVFTASVQFS